jgi:hypothetical protein
MQEDCICGQSSWLQIQMSGFDSRRYQIFREVEGLERGQLSPMSTTEELLGRKSNGSCLENWEYLRRGPLCLPRNTLYPQKLALSSSTSGCRSVGIVPSRTKGHGVCFVLFVWDYARSCIFCACDAAQIYIVLRFSSRINVNSDPPWTTEVRNSNAM